MWVEGGFAPETFWDQTVRSFRNALAGSAKRRLTESWQTAALTAAASVGKLKSLDEYLPSDTPISRSEALANAKLIHGFNLMKARGVPLKIERLH